VIAVDAADDSDLVWLPDGRRAQIWEGGDQDGSAVFFFHGCPDSRLAARSGDAPARHAGVRLIAVNRPGYGRSDLNESSHRSVAADTAAVADRLGIGRFAVLGMSIGGPYALACAVRYPERVSAVAAVAAPAIASELDPPYHRDDLSPAQREFFSRLPVSTLAECMEQFRPDYEVYAASVAADDDDNVALARRWLATLPPVDAVLLADLSADDLAQAAREALASPDGYLRDAALTFHAWEFRPEDVRCPTLLMYGECDANATPRNGTWLAEHIAGSTMTVRHTSHLATLIEHWDELLTTLASAS
jgi:pimeloyl-ACP methyl ester carboxylesterase